jgi:NAD(P)H-hydrate epimerase
MIGVGGSEDIKGLANEILIKLKSNYALKIAVDAPTGLNTDTGVASEYCFHADFTITMFAPKTGFFLNDGPKVCGNINTAYLGAPQSIVDSLAEISILEDNDLIELIPLREKNTSKFDYGRVMIIAGSEKYLGASCLNANAAITAGAGLVQLYSTNMHPSLLPEIIFQKLPETVDGTIDESSIDIILNDLNNVNTVAIGSGIGDNPSTINFVKQIIELIPNDKVMIIDADGLRAISKDSILNKNIILTPHAGEFSRLTGIERELIEKSPNAYVNEWAKKLNCNIVLKSHPVVIGNDELSYWNITGNAGMATAGSGDVLTGIIAGLAAQGIEPLTASALGVYLHAKAGDIYTDYFNEESLTASELINYLPEAMNIR